MTNEERISALEAEVDLFKDFKDKFEDLPTIVAFIWEKSDNIVTIAKSIKEEVNKVFENKTYLLDSEIEELRKAKNDLSNLFKSLKN